MRVLALAIFFFLLIASDSPARTLEGGVEIQSNSAHEAGEIKEQTAQLDSGQNIQPAQPTWIKGKVFSNDGMFMYTFWQCFPFKKEFRWELPAHRATTIHVRPDVLKYWKGFKPEGSCPVICTPIADGKYRFFHQRPDGPHGYLERVGLSQNGFPRYRYWFDDDQANSSSGRIPTD